MGIMINNRSDIEQFRLHVLFRGLKLELMGMKMSRGASCYKTLKSMGFTGTKQQAIPHWLRCSTGHLRAFKQFILSHCDRVACDALLHYLKGVTQ